MNTDHRTDISTGFGNLDSLYIGINGVGVESQAALGVFIWFLNFDCLVFLAFRSEGGWDGGRRRGDG